MSRTASPPIALPADRERLILELDALVGEARELCAGWSEVQLNWQADGRRRWSVLQCIEHLTRSNIVYLPALREAADDLCLSGQTAAGEMRPTLLGRLFVRWLEPPYRMKAKVPLDAMVPPSSLDRDATLEAFARTQCEVTDLLASCGAWDLNAVRFRNPMAGDRRLFNLATGFLVIAAHERRHFWQARQVLGRSDFPI